MTTKSLKNWCHSVLPANFRQVTSKTSELQQFLREHLPEPVNQQVSVINSSQDEVVVAVSDPQVANFLRLYSAEIQQQMRETFHSRQVLKIRTLPGSMLEVGNRPGAKKPLRQTAETVRQFQHSANSVEDEHLRQILKSLAESMKEKALK